MANTLYNYGRQLFLGGDLDWRSDPMKVCLVDTGAGMYSFAAAHKFFSEVSTAAIVGQPIPLYGPGGSGPRDITDGAADAENSTFLGVGGAGSPNVNSIEAIIIFHDTGSAPSSELIAYIDTATGLPITPNGGDIIVTWDNGVNKIFRL